SSTSFLFVTMPYELVDGLPSASVMGVSKPCSPSPSWKTSPAMMLLGSTIASTSPFCTLMRHTERAGTGTILIPAPVALFKRSSKLREDDREVTQTRFPCRAAADTTRAPRGGGPDLRFWGRWGGRAAGTRRSTDC